MGELAIIWLIWPFVGNSLGQVKPLEIHSSVWINVVSCLLLACVFLEKWNRVNLILKERWLLLNVQVLFQKTFLNCHTMISTLAGVATLHSTSIERHLYIPLFKALSYLLLQWQLCYCRKSKSSKDLFLVAILSLISYVTLRESLRYSALSCATGGNPSDHPDEINGVEFYSHFTDEETEAREK